MEKLQPVIAQRFWIAFGFALILCLVGWWLDTAASAKLIEEREDAIKKAVSAASVGGGVPNNDWKAALDEINVKQQAALDRAESVLFDRQQAAKAWPKEMAPYMNGVPYRGTLADKNPLDIYRDIYDSLIRDLWLSAKPFNPDTKTGKVVINQAILPRHTPGKWDTTAPTWKEVWDGQEDIWLVRALLDSIRRMNDSTDGTVVESPVREVSVLQLRGGYRVDGEAQGGGGSGSGGLGGGGGGEAEAEGGFGDDNEGFGGSGGGMFGGGGGGRAGGDVSSIADEELGSATAGPSESEGEEAETGGEGGGGAFSETGGSALFGGMGGSGSSVAGRRYVDDEEGSPFKTRGFVLQAKVRQDMVPELISQLTDSPWPVEILRVHQWEVNPDPVIAAAGRTGGATGGAFPGAAPPAGGFGAPARSFGAPGGGFGAPRPGFGAPGGGFGARSNPLGPAGAGAGVEQEDGRSPGSVESMEGYELARVALADPALVEVIIVGLLTIYMPPEEDPDAEALADSDPGQDVSVEPVETPGDGTDQPADADGTQPTTDGTQPSDSTTDPGTQPETPPTGSDAETPADGGSNEPLPEGFGGETPAGTDPGETSPEADPTSAGTPPQS